MSDDLTLEKMKISERLTTLETKFTDIEPLIKDIHKEIVGFNGNMGIKTRIAIIEKDRKDSEKHWFVIYTGIITLAIKSFWEMLKK